MTQEGTRRHESVRLEHPKGGTLVGDVWHEAANPGHVVVFVHGLSSLRVGEKAQSLEAACARRGWPFAAFDVRGHGDSTGTLFDLTCSNLLEDLEVVRGALAERGLHRVLPVGSSMGGWATSWWAQLAADAIPGIVLLAPSLHFPLGLWNRLRPRARENWQNTGKLHLVNDWIDAYFSYRLIEDAENFPLDSLVANWRHPTLIFHGMKDDVVPHANTLEVIERVTYPNIEVRLLRDGDHRLVAYKDDIAESACRFFEKLVNR